MRSKIAFHVLVRSVRNRQSFGPSVTISPALKGPPGSISTRGPSENLLVTMSRKVSAAITPIDISMSCMMFFIEFSACRELELQAINGLNEARNLPFFGINVDRPKQKKTFDCGYLLHTRFWKYVHMILVSDLQGVTYSSLSRT